MIRKWLFRTAILATAVGVQAWLRTPSRSKPRRLTYAPAPMSPEMQAVIDTLDELGGKPIETLSAAEARQQPMPGDAMAKLLAGRAAPVPLQISVDKRSILGPAGEIPITVFTPPGEGPFPVVLYFHGGGFVLADAGAYADSAKAIADQARAVVVSVDYRRAPEHRFPAAADDAFAAYEWLLAHANELKGDLRRIAVAGESAGGNLAAGVAMKARDRGIFPPLLQLLIYPLVDNQTHNSSYRRYADAKPLNRAMMEWFFNHYLRSRRDAHDRYAFPNKARSLRDLAPAVIITAEIDPLAEEGRNYARRLQSEGVSVAAEHYDGVTHEFFGMGALLPQARAAQAFAAAELVKVFGEVQRS